MEDRIADHYEQLHQNSVTEILARGVIPDPFIDDPTDQRYGMTLLCRPNLKVWQKVEAFLNSLSRPLSQQYVYGIEDCHVTVMPIISCEVGFSLHQVNHEDYYPLIQRSLIGVTPFKIRFEGVILSPSAVLIKGYAEEGKLNKIRENLRMEFGGSNVQQSLDKRYQLKTAHCTVVRFKQPLEDTQLMLSRIEEAKFLPFGSFEVRQLEFVFNDWYQRHEKVITLKTFSLPQSEEW